MGGSMKFTDLKEQVIDAVCAYSVVNAVKIAKI